MQVVIEFERVVDAVDLLGVESIMYSVDYPFIGAERASEFLEMAQLTDAEKDLISFQTAERVLRL